MSEASIRRLVYSCSLAVRWGDMDAFGHVNNALYLRYLEEARVQMLVNMLGNQITDGDFATVVINVSCTFLKPITYPDSVRIDCYVGELGRSSFMTWYEVFALSAPNEMASEGSAKVVWMDRRTGKSAPLPAYLVQAVTG
ncbi:acyl-CoA thioesterase [Thiothrix eikelboomii]|uniref:Acyl-CoA thioester hydrolase n=1 Tax=Thiothrix eikelboomii TaxID=92487 RepID=A0A1T4XG85_9GAMM|nr:thioesterase family protein [Thiothrix eikelboomii]SKA88556.1 acyl-CoA thioester hydrolase [Thiothrix eikelboomii]